MNDPTSGGDPPRPRGYHLIEAEARLLESLIADRPHATEGQIIALFRARTGRTLNHRAVQIRRRPRPPGPGNGHLTDAERAILDRLIRESEGRASYREVADQFEALAGRPIAPQTVHRRAVDRLGLPRVGKGRGPGNGRLTDAERAILGRLIRESEGEASYREVADQFEALAGRPIDPKTAWRHAVDRLGLPRVGPGRGPRTRPAAVAARLAEESARKRAEAREDRARVDNSPRVGKSGRYHPGGPS